MNDTRTGPRYWLAVRLVRKSAWWWPRSERVSIALGRIASAVRGHG